MKWLVAIILFFFICTSASALNKYVDSTSGNDANNGNTAGTAYKSITKVNQIMASLSNGDSVLFKRGEFWHNQIRLSHSIIHFGAYGSGSDPLISGFTIVSGFARVGTSDVWQSAAITGSNTGIRMVTFSDVAQAMGRWPNADAANGGYAVYDSMASLTAIRSITAMPFDFTGAKLCMRKIADILCPETVTSVSGSTINHENLTGTNYKGFDAYGYFIEDALATLNAQNEWYFNPSTRRLFIYSATSPTNIKISTIDTLILVGGFDNCTFDNISFEGGDKCGIMIGGPTLGNSTGTAVRGCEFNNMGRDGIYATNDNNLVVTQCYFNHILNDGVQMSNQGGNTINSTITYNTLKNIGYLPGMGFLDYSNGFKFSMEGITNGTSAVAGQLGMTAKFNSIDTVGHIGIRFFQNNTFVDSNLVNYHNFITDDAGGINVFDNFTGLIETNRTIIGNIVTNGIGAGIGASGYPIVNGIYIDDKSDGIIIQRNFVGNVSWVSGSFDGSAIYVHNGTNLNILLNVCFNGGYAQLTLAHDGNAVGFPMRNINVQNNLFFSKVNTARFVVTRTRLPASDMDSIYNPINNNRYWRPTLITGSTYQTVVNYKGSPQTVRDFTLPLWQSTYPPYDAASTQGVSNTGVSDFVCNFSDHDSTLNFSGLSYLVPQYNSPYQIVYNNSMIMAPYTGYIRVSNGSVPPVNKFPVANSGGDVVITLPVNSANLLGTGSDTDGVIVSYAWAQLSGPNTAVITPPSSLTTGTTTVSNLIQGIYQFQLTVTDNNGATGTAIARVTVNAAIPNTPPTADAGVDKIITLPTTTTNVTGSGTNGSGTSRTYEWTQISGPATATVISPTSATTTINSLTVDGTYTFRFKVTNNLSDTAVDFMQVFVNPAPIVLPTANAGSDIAITLPTTSTSATASATLGSGTLVSYTWTFISGPTAATFGSANALTTTINNLTTVGTYTVQFTVLNSQGNSASDNLNIVVSPAIPPVNQPPISVPGANQTITLPTNTVTVNGSGSSDPDGTITAFQWFITGPNVATSTTPNAVSTTFGNLIQGVYSARLKVTDNNSDTGSATMTITVNAAPNVLPTAVAGTDIVITLPTNSTSVDGSGSSDPDGITAYQWIQLSGPTAAVLATPNAVSTTVGSLVEGVYILQLKVTGSNGASDTAVDAIQITVNPTIILTPPTANVNTINPISLPVNFVTLTGSGTDGSGTINFQEWTLISGPGSGGDISTPNNYTTLVSNLVAGTYIFQLEVRDTNGLSGTGLVQVIVRPVLRLQSVLLRGYGVQ